MSLEVCNNIFLLSFYCILFDTFKYNFETLGTYYIFLKKKKQELII